MRRILTYFIVVILSLSCRQQYDIASLSGSFKGVDGGKHTLSTSVSLELNKDKTCSLTRMLDLAVIRCQGEWEVLSSGEIEIKCNNNPVESGVVKALKSGCCIEETFQIKVLSKNKLKLGNSILKRKD